jgi:hypothetical protein
LEHSVGVVQQRESDPATESELEPVDADVTYILELEAKLQKAFEAENRPFIEVDTDSDEFGTFYRVWQGRHYLGHFWQSLQDGKWLTDTQGRRERGRYATALRAKRAILSAWGFPIN